VDQERTVPEELADKDGAVIAIDGKKNSASTFPRDIGVADDIDLSACRPSS
jgi:hypothetical protein